MKALFADAWESDLAASLSFWCLMFFVSRSFISAHKHDMAFVGCGGGAVLACLTYFGSRYVVSRWVRLPSWIWLGYGAPAFTVSVIFLVRHREHIERSSFSPQYLFYIIRDDLGFLAVSVGLLTVMTLVAIALFRLPAAIREQGKLP